MMQILVSNNQTIQVNGNVGAAFITAVYTPQSAHPVEKRDPFFGLGRLQIWIPSSDGMSGA